MTCYSAFFRHVLARIDAERAHEGASCLLRAAGTPGLSRIISAALNTPREPVEAFGRTLSSRLGLAAGFDKNARMAPGLAALGFGFIEVGTVTAHAQPGNDRPRLFRVTSERALRNRMGFNNDGARAIALRLARLRATPAGKRLVLGVNIGKSKVTPAPHAVSDYATSAKLLAPYADYLVVNVSSPNTVGLRNLQAVDSLAPILAAVQRAANHSAARHVPVLVKIAPDLADEDVEAVADLAAAQDLAGVVAVNTTIAHNHGPGGLSGPLLKPRGLQVVGLLRRRLGPHATIIGVGGITGGEDAREYVRAGATLVQAYTGFIYGGPAWPARTGRALSLRRGTRPA